MFSSETGLRENIKALIQPSSISRSKKKKKKIVEEKLNENECSPTGS